MIVCEISQPACIPRARADFVSWSSQSVPARKARSDFSGLIRPVYTDASGVQYARLSSGAYHFRTGLCG